MAILQDLRALNLAEAQVNLWTVKGPTGAAAEAPTYSARWVETTEDVDSALKDVFLTDIARIEEVLEYGLLAQNNEASALRLPVDETHAAILLEVLKEEAPGKKASKVKHLLNTKFYVAKFIIDDQITYAVRRADSAWRTKKANSISNLYFADEILAIDERPHFELSRHFDFIVFGQDILIFNKGAFESVLRHKEAQREDFAQLQEEPEFQTVFVDLAPLVTHVGDNKIQLRRACAIRAKGHYKDEQFMNRLRNSQADYGLAIQFDAEGKIIVTPETCAQIMTALLDHRLKSGFSTLVYDVQNTTQVAM
jgi:hypothetical protein